MSSYLDMNGLKYLWSKIKNMIQTEISKLNEDKSSITDQELLEKIYPVGSIYISANATNPSNLFGGTWESIKDKFLLAAGTIYNAGNTGGKASITLSTSQLPSHRHSIPSLTGEAESNGSHSHTWSMSGCNYTGEHGHVGITIDGVPFSVYNGDSGYGYGVDLRANYRYSEL